MMSYEEVMALAKKISEEQAQLVTKMRRELDRREARARREMELERIEHQEQKALEAEEQKKNPKPLFISRKKYAEMQEAARSEREKKVPSPKIPTTVVASHPVKSAFSQPNTARSVPEKKVFMQDFKASASFAGKTANSSTYVEPKKVTEIKKPISKPKALPSANIATLPDITVQRFSQASEKLKPQRRDNHIKRATPASPNLRRKVLPSDKASPPLARVKISQPAPKQQPSIPVLKRPLAAEARTNSSGLTGSRFAKYGPLDDEPPLKSIKPSASSRPNKTPTQYLSKASEALEPKARAKAPSGDKLFQPVKSSLNAQDRIRSSYSDRTRVSDRDGARSSGIVRKHSSEQLFSKPSKLTNKEIRKTHVELPSPRRQASSSRQRPFAIKDDIIDEEYAKKNISSIIGNLFKYDRNKYRDDFSDDDMEVSASRVRAEESRSARLGRLEDQREEELERQRLLRLRQKKSSR